MNTYHWLIICTSCWLAILWMCTFIKHDLFILMLWYLGPCWSLIAPPRASQFLEIQTYLPVSTSFTDKPVNPESLSSNHLLYLNLSPPAVITKDQAPDKQEQCQNPRAHWNYSHYPILNLLILPFLLLPTETIIKVLVHIIPFLPLPQDWCFCFQGTMNKIFFLLDSHFHVYISYRTWLQVLGILKPVWVCV